MSRAKFAPFDKNKIRDLFCDKCLVLVESMDMNEADLICEKCAERIKDYFARLIKENNSEN
jgi:hypothetical protein